MPVVIGIIDYPFWLVCPKFKSSLFKVTGSLSYKGIGNGVEGIGKLVDHYWGTCPIRSFLLETRQRWGRRV